MKLHTEQTDVYCPYCGESIEIIVDSSQGTHRYVEDCFVCCRPIEMEIVIDGDNFYVSASHEDDV